MAIWHPAQLLVERSTFSAQGCGFPIAAACSTAKLDTFQARWMSTGLSAEDFPLVELMKQVEVIKVRHISVVRIARGLSWTCRGRLPAGWRGRGPYREIISGTYFHIRGRSRAIRNKEICRTLITLGRRPSKNQESAMV